MIYIHKAACISPQNFEQDLKESSDNRLKALEPSYENIPRGILRRMGKAVRIGVGAALPVLKGEDNIYGVIIGTANGGMEDCIRFLNQIIDYEEGQLTPTNFVQSTTNAIAGQIGLMTSNTGYNTTHVHRGVAFENALLDASFIAAENPGSKLLVGGVDEISTYNYNIDFLAGWYKKEVSSNIGLYESKTSGSIAGEGAAMFVASSDASNAVMQLKAVHTSHSDQQEDIQAIIDQIKSKCKIDAILSGENGDFRLNHHYEKVEAEFEEASVWRYKHLCGEYPTTTSFAFWLAMQAFEKGEVSSMIDVKRGRRDAGKTILIYNAYQGKQHNFIIVQGV